MILTQSQAENEVVNQMLTGRHVFNMFREAQLWCAAERLKLRGAIKAGPIANSYDIACLVCCQSPYAPCGEHPVVVSQSKPDWLQPMGADQYVSGRKLVEHRPSFEEAKEIARKA
jgi:hypothetical protein